MGQGMEAQFLNSVKVLMETSSVDQWTSAVFLILSKFSSNPVILSLPSAVTLQYSSWGSIQFLTSTIKVFYCCFVTVILLPLRIITWYVGHLIWNSQRGRDPQLENHWPNPERKNGKEDEEVTPKDVIGPSVHLPTSDHFLLKLHVCSYMDWGTWGHQKLSKNSFTY